MRLRRLCLLALVLLPVALRAADDPRPALFRDGDVVCFIGDSITHGRKYHAYLYSYYLTRFPERRIRFANCGISGDSAAGAVGRFDWDIAPVRPTVASIMLGMNDVSRGLYGKDQPDQATLAAREQAITRHHQSMTKLAELLRDLCAPQLIFVRPTPYDQTVKNDTPNLFGVNEALGRCGDLGAGLARQFGGSVVDLHGPMTALNLKLQQDDPAFTLIGTDRVHPGDAGMLVMAYYYLKAQDAPAVVSDVVLEGGRVVKSEQATVTALTATADRVACEVLERALPWPLEASSQAALGWVPLVDELNRELLTVRGLAAGTWRLSIDGQAVADLPAETWAAGVNLALNPATPQAKQAAEVQALNLQRHGLAARLRSVAQVHMMLTNAKVNLDDPAAMQAFFDDFVARRAGSNAPYFKGTFEGYLKTKPEVETIRGQIEELVQQLWRRNQPVKHTYEWSRLAG